jgi:hypothetical protein
MSDQQLISQMERWGYQLKPGEPPYAPGHHRLLVAIREFPTEMHYDPESIQLRMGDAGDSVNWTTIRLRFPVYGIKQVGLGRLIIADRVDKRVEFFTYGGELDATYSHDEAVYELRSGAPILEITEDLQSFPDQLAFETEVIVAEAQARWHGNDQAYSRQLAQLEAGPCYLAAVRSILRHYERTLALRETFHMFHAALKKEQEALAGAGLWHDTIPCLEALLEPGGEFAHPAA